MDRIYKDVIGAGALLVLCLVGGAILNELRAKPFPLSHASPREGLGEFLDELSAGPAVLAPNGANVDVEEMKAVVASHGAIIVDARPEIFYRLGHIPTALSLPRDDFQDRYHAVMPFLQSKRDRDFVVYCSSNDCEDSQLVAEALGQLGYGHVRIFRGGWSEWEGENLPEERE